MLRRSLLTGAVAGSALARPLKALAQGPTPPSLEELLAPPAIAGAAISPNGEAIAILRQTTKGDERGSYIEMQQVSKLGVSNNFRVGDMGVEAVRWKTDEKLLIWVHRGFTVMASPMLSLILLLPIRRLGVMGADGKSFSLLFNNQPKLAEATTDLATVVDFLPDDPSHIVMQFPDLARGVTALHKVNIDTGVSTLVERGTATTHSWRTQDGAAVFRTDVSSNGRIATYFGRPPGEIEWKRIRQVRQSDFEKLKLDFEVLGPTSDAGVLFVTTMTEADQARALRTFDLRTLAFGPVVAERPNRDIVGYLTDPGGKMLATTYQDDRLSYQFSDPEMASGFRLVEGVFKRQCNLTVVDMSADSRRWIVRADGPRDRGSYIYFDRSLNQIGYLGVEQPALTEDRLAAVESLTVTTRDGETIRAYLTVPLQKGPRPMVVLPHGGPEVRDVYGFDVMAQALAAQGWYVLQPNFRGSGGYGRAFADAGRRQWNGRVLEDIEVAVDQVLATGRITPGRTAICGVSFGGYAALMAAVRRPDAYRAVVSIAGVSDVIDAVNEERDEPAAHAYWMRTAGDPRTDREMMMAASPRRRAAEIKAPVLLLHGKLDRTVMPSQSKDMAAALRRAGKTYEYFELPRVAHGGDAEAWTEVLKRTIAFLKTHLA
jgi:dipeptidyl aminopeptidase/acylaminoacyl peptidase